MNYGKYLLIVIAILASGCTTNFYTIGHNKGYCEENGCDYQDTGVCASPYYIINNTREYNKKSYKNIIGE